MANHIFGPSQWEPDERIPFPGTRRFVEGFTEFAGTCLLFMPLPPTRPVYCQRTGGCPWGKGSCRPDRRHHSHRLHAAPGRGYESRSTLTQGPGIVPYPPLSKHGLKIHGPFLRRKNILRRYEDWIAERLSRIGASFLPAKDAKGLDVISGKPTPKVCRSNGIIF